MRPRSFAQAAILYNLQDTYDNWIPTRFELNSWITMNPRKRGGHAKDSRSHGGDNIEGSFKARILEFQFGPSGTVVSKVRVQHAYMFRHLQLDPAVPVTSIGCNYLYPPTLKIGWIQRVSLVSFMYCTPNWGSLLEDAAHTKNCCKRVFFYNASYSPPQDKDRYGRLEAIPLPGFDDPMWPLPDMVTSKSFRS